MINKRLLIKNLLSHNDENSFYDKKMKLSLTSKEGKYKSFYESYFYNKKFYHNYSIRYKIYHQNLK